jgi:hypothetical protein
MPLIQSNKSCGYIYPLPPLATSVLPGTRKLRREWVSEPFTEDDKVDHPGDIVPEENPSVDSLEKVTSEDSGQVLRLKPKGDDVTPDDGYEWVVVACVFLINEHTWGINSSYGVFLTLPIH